MGPSVPMPSTSQPDSDRKAAPTPASGEAGAAEVWGWPGQRQARRERQRDIALGAGEIETQHKRPLQREAEGWGVTWGRGRGQTGAQVDGLGRVPTMLPLQVQASRCTTEWDRERRARSGSGDQAGWAGAGSPRPHDEASLVPLQPDPVSVKDTLDEAQGQAEEARLTQQGPVPAAG